MSDPTPGPELTDAADPSPSSRRDLALGVAAGVVVSAAYLAYVAYYAINIPQGDDLTVIPNIYAALHGTLTFNDLWQQHTEARMLFPNLVFLASGSVDHFNEKTLALVSAVIFIASFVVLLRVFRAYLGRRLGPLTVLSVGVVFFSLADYGNALWDFQIAWYMTVFCLVAILYLLLVQPWSPRLCFVLAIVAAVIGSYSFTQGLLLWPIGLICIVWKSAHERPTKLHAAIWVGVGVVTTVVYFVAFNSKNNGCFSTPRGCSTSYAVEHPILVVQFMVALLGNVVPTSGLNIFETNSVLHIGAHEFLGTVIGLVAVFVIVQSLRERRRRSELPLPLVLVAYGLLLDLLIASGRVGTGIGNAIIQTRYTMANLLLLVGIVMYAWNHIPRRGARDDRRLPVWVSVVALAVLAIFVVVQGVESTNYGLSNGRALDKRTKVEARLMANLDRIPTSEQQCYVDQVIFFGLGGPDAAANFRPIVKEAQDEHLSLFGSSAYQAYRAEGPPVSSGCGPVGP